MMRSWLLDLEEPEFLREQCSENCALFLAESDPVHGFPQIFNQLQKTFQPRCLHFDPTYKEKASHWGYEYGEFNNGRKTNACSLGTYSIVWTWSDAEKWKMVSLTIKV